jgi:trk system potassium uptake protein
LAEKNGRKQDGVVVAGLGRFGSAVAQSLVHLGHEVLAIDESEDVVQEYANRLTLVVEADSCNIDALRRLGVGEYAHAVVGIGTGIEASVLTVLALSELGIPDIWAKAVNPRHGRILERTGAHHVVYPEAAMGERVAHLATGRMIDFIEFEDDFAIAKTRAPLEAAGKTLEASDLRGKYGVTVIGIKRAREDFVHAKAEMIIERTDILIVSGPTRKIERFAALS